MKTYNVILEGFDSRGGFFVTFQVAALSAAAASQLALQSALSSGMSILGVDETTEHGDAGASGNEKVLRVFGKSYFPADLEF